MEIVYNLKKYTKQAKKFYDSKAWKIFRNYYIQKRILIDGGICEHCKDRLGFILDHKEEINELNITDPNITLNEENVQYLCHECHNKKTFSKNNSRLVRFDAEGNPIFNDIAPI